MDKISTVGEEFKSICLDESYFSQVNMRIEPNKGVFNPSKHHHSVYFQWKMLNFSEFQVGVNTQSFVLKGCTAIWKMSLVKVKTAANTKIDNGEEQMEILLLKDSSSEKVITVDCYIRIRGKDSSLGVWKKSAIFSDLITECKLVSAPVPARPKAPNDRQGISFNIPEDNLYVEGRLTFQGCCKPQNYLKDGESFELCKFRTVKTVLSKL